MRIDLVQPVVAGDIGGNVVIEALQRIPHVGVFIDTPVFLGEVGIHRFDRFLDELPGFAQRGVLLAIENEGLGGFGVTVLNEDFFDQVLDILNGRDSPILVNDLEDPDNLATDAGSLLHISATDRLD